MRYRTTLRNASCNYLLHTFLLIARRKNVNITPCTVCFILIQHSQMMLISLRVKINDINFLQLNDLLIFVFYNSLNTIVILCPSFYETNKTGHTLQILLTLSLPTRHYLVILQIFCKLNNLRTCCGNKEAENMLSAQNIRSCVWLMTR